MRKKLFELTKTKKLILISAFSFVIAAIVLYMFVLPFLFSNTLVLNAVSKMIYKTAGVEFSLIEPELKTDLMPSVSLSFKEFSLKKENNNILHVKNFKTAFSFDLLFKKELNFKKLGADYISFDLDNFNAAFSLPQNKNSNETKKSPYKINIFNSVFYLNECDIKATLANETKLNLKGRKILIEEKKNPKHVRFIFDANLKAETGEMNFKFSDNNRFYIKNRTLVIDDCPFFINKSKILVESLSNEGSYAVILKSKDFQIKDGSEFLGLNLILNNGSDIVNELKDIKGTSDFYVRLDNNGLKGAINVKNGFFKLKSLANLPVYANKGTINITPDIIKLENFIGYYGNSSDNKLSLEGKVSDYYRSVDTKISVKTFMTDDFTRNYLSKLIGCTVTMTGEKPAGTLIEIYSKNGTLDISYMAKINSGNDILIENTSLSPINYDRAVKCDMHLNGNILNIESIKYFIAREITKNSKGKIRPILTMNGSVDIMNNSKILNFGFEIPKPLPSEFLNIFAGRGVFKKGLISGGIEWINTGKIPKLKGELFFDKVIIPSQRLFIKEGSFTTDRDYLKISSNGYYRRSLYNLDGKISNSITFPLVIENFNLSLDNIDLFKLLEEQTAPKIENPSEEDNFVNAIESNSIQTSEVSAPAFIPGIIKIKEGIFNLAKGSYKDIKFSNLKALMSLDEYGNLKIDSNRFDFAEGHSSVRIICNLAENKFRAILGAKDINSDTVASALLDLKREITGLASGIIDINIDETLKLNGKMKFDIKNGTIEKMGLVEYALNFVSFFRNPMAMISPSTLFDLVNIPEGSFDKIWGELLIKDNVINRMMIKSTADELATLITGRFDLETRDTSLRIYTKFTNKNKGFTGFLRSLSLNSLANKGVFGAKNDENYYSAELSLIPELKEDEKNSRVFLTTVEGDVEHNNFLSSLKKIK